VIRRLLVAAALAASLAPPAHAQYFGQNKVRYVRHDFRVLATPHFDVHYYPEEAETASLVARMAERWYTRLSAIFGHELRRRQPILLYAGHPAFSQTSVIDGDIGEGTGGVTDFARQRVVLPCAGSLGETDHVLGHELVHAFQFDVTRKKSGGLGAARLPLWFIEGMAEYLSLGREHPQTAMWMREAVRTEAVPELRRLGAPDFFPYRYGHAFWAYVGGRFGDDRIPEILRLAGRTGNALAAIETVLKTDAQTLSREWQAALEAAYAPTLQDRGVPGPEARPAITEARSGGRLNLGPALSPDGKQILFISERSRMAVDLYLADTDSGRVRRHVVNRAVDPHFESLQFAASSAAWDPSGRRFAFAAVHAGRPRISIVDAARGTTEREIAFDDLDEITSPAWSPDGRTLAFSALRGGVSDLVLYDLAEDARHTLTEDAFADLQPAWSPDGRSLAFVTDRFSTNLRSLRMGTYGVALFDLDSGEIGPLPAFEGASSVSPQWSRDGSALFFVSDRDGISDVYRLALATGEMRQVTRIGSGVMGLTPVSPALSSASAVDRLAFSVFVEGRYEIFTIDSAVVLAGRPLLLPAEGAPARAAGRLPPIAAATPVAYSPAAPATFPEKEYRPRITLDRVGQPFLSASGGAFGTYVSAGGALFWSDMLGEQTVITAAELRGKTLATFAAYKNTRGRWNWGLVAEQVPFQTGTFSSGFSDLDGRTVSVEQSFRFQETSRRLGGILAYPLSRSDRIEWSAGYRRVSFGSDVSTRTFSIANGLEIARDDRSLPAPRALDIGDVGAAYVRDAAAFGATSPILGRRLRAEITTSVGSVRHTDVLADLRRYVMPVRPVTVAARALFFGRLGRDAEDPRYASLFLGHQGLVRGYTLGSYASSACLGNIGIASCTAVEDFVGSRILVGNVEVRAPLLPFLRRGGSWPLPVEVALFGDAGLAWTREVPGIRSARPARSVGAALRVNVLGFLVGEVDYVRPFDRAAGGGRWELSIGPGF
jgi:Tol biopolymer transport system component